MTVENVNMIFDCIKIIIMLRMRKLIFLLSLTLSNCTEKNVFHSVI